MKKIIFVFIFISIFLNGCMMLMMDGKMEMLHDLDEISSNNHFRHTSIEKEITKVLNQQVDEWNRGSISGYMKTYEKNDSTLFASGGDIILGWQTVLERFEKKYSSKELMGELTFSDLKVEVYSKNSAMAFGRWKISRQQNPVNGLFTLILKKIKGEWKVVHDHSSIAQ